MTDKEREEYIKNIVRLICYIGVALVALWILYKSVFMLTLASLRGGY